MDEREHAAKRPRSRPRLAPGEGATATRTALGADGVVTPPPGAVAAYASAAMPLPDPRDPRVLEHLRQRVAGGGYAVSEADLVRAIRGWGQRREPGVVRQLCELLVLRCMPEFQRRAWGLRHRPALMEDAIAGMIEQLLKEVQDRSETFMTLNFIHYLHCLCADNFGRVLRQEGLSYRRDAQGRPTGKPRHVPQALVERLDLESDSGEDTSAPREIAARDDPLDARLAALEAQRILAYLPDALDRQIMVLRALEHMHWEEIATVCGKTERTMRLRYEKARARLRECLLTEHAHGIGA